MNTIFVSLGIFASHIARISFVLMRDGCIAVIFRVHVSTWQRVSHFYLNLDTPYCDYYFH